MISNSSWKGLIKLSSMLIVLMMVIAACGGGTSPDDGGKQSEHHIEDSESTDHSEEDNTSDVDDADDELRTEQVFDFEATEGLLAVRYFNMPGSDNNGDAILVTTPDGKHMMIDAGTPDGGAQVLEILDEKGIDQLDAIINTHPHWDHLGGFPEIVRKKQVDRAYIIDHPYPQSGTYNTFIAGLKNRNIEINYIEEGVEFELGEHVSIEVLRPLKGELPDAIEGYSPAQINHFSSVFKVIYEDTSFMFTGDIYKKREAEMLENIPHEELKADFLHVPHHGSSTSSSSSFIETVSPKFAVISDNDLIDFKLINRYEFYGAETYQTKLHGHILLTSDGKNLEVLTENDWENPLLN